MQIFPQSAFRAGLHFPATLAKRLLFLLGFMISPLHAKESAGPIRVACVGDSITRGGGTEYPALDAYPAQLERMLGGEAYVVGRFGSSGSTLMNSGDMPYQKTQAFQQALAFKPDVVVIQLGTNDTKLQNWEHRGEFAADYTALVNRFLALASRPRIYLSLPPVITGDPNFAGMHEAAILEQIPLIKAVARETGSEIIDVHGAFERHENRDALMRDRVHPNTAGAALLAKTVYAALAGHAFEGGVPDSFRSRWNGYERVDFGVSHRAAILIVPKKAAPGRPWIWRTEFFGAFPSVDLALLEKGWHVAYLDVQNLYGAPAALDAMDGMPAYLKEHYDIAARPVLEGFSRGGLFAFNWAARHPGQVVALYVDAPVCDFKSWPGGRGRGKGSPADWTRCLKAYGLTEEQALAYPANPVDNLAPLAAAKIPIIAVAGDADDVVPLEENIGVVEKRYRELGGEIRVIVKPGVGHHPHSLEDPTPVVEFLSDNSLAKSVRN